MRRPSGRYAGVQVKTRQQGADPFKASDEEILAALTKFVRADAQAGDAFESFCVATNHHFFSAKKNGKNLRHLLELARGQEAPPSSGILGKFIAKLARRSECSVEQVLKTLRKTTCDDDLPKLRDGLRNLCEQISTLHPPCESLSYPQLKRAAEALVAEATRASTLDHAQTLPAYLGIVPNPVAQEVQARVDGKRLTADRVRAVLDQIANAPAELLTEAEPTSPIALPPEQSVLAKKLTAGGLSAQTVDAARDCWSSAMSQQLAWNSTLGEQKALDRHRHLKTLVFNEAAAAYEQHKHLPQPAPSMLDDLKARLRGRRSMSPADVFQCYEEQLLGRAYMLTEECKLWWSAKFDLAAGDGDGPH